jgi:N utilization substance protein A
MNRELINIIEQMSRERGIPKDTILNNLESALLSAARKKYGIEANLGIKIDPKSGEISITALKKVVKEVENPNEQISKSDAKKLDASKRVGSEIEAPIDLVDFGRIAAQTAKQVLFQKVRESEREAIYEEYKDKVGQITSGVVIRKERNNYYVAIGRAEAMLPQKETLSSETLKRGDNVRVYIDDVKVPPKGPVILLSRANPNFVADLFKMEVPEIYEGIVVIKDIVREAGDRTKLTVYSKNPSIDPVGACVGMKGTRVQSIVRELKGERIDIIPWTDDPRTLLVKALSPAHVDKIGINEEEKSAMVVVSEQQLLAAIGKKGQNVRLAMKLTGWDIDIISESEYNKMKAGESPEGEEEEQKPESEEVKSNNAQANEDEQT